VRARRGRRHHARLGVEHLEHRLRVALAVEEASELALRERERRREIPRLGRDRPGRRLLAGHGVELRHRHERAGAGDLILERLRLGVQPRGAGGPRVPLLGLKQAHARVLLVRERLRRHGTERRRREH
jgi:hypothetical protein